MQNPLFPTSSDNTGQNNNSGSTIPDYLRTPSTTPKKVINPLAPSDPERNAAADLIRQKLDALYANEPAAKEELAEVAAAQQPLSVHQRFMQGLQASGRSLAEIQAAWHGYYTSLPDSEKHTVWQEFYAANQNNTPYQKHLQQRDQTAARQPQPAASTGPVAITVEEPTYMPPRPAAPYTSRGRKKLSKPSIPSPSTQTVAELKRRIQNTVKANKHVTKSNFQSLAFGLACGAVVLVIFMFSFFNEVVISPFIQPSRTASETPVIVDPASAVTSKDPKVIIPKINVEIPVDYSQTTTSEAAIETALDSAVVHYPTTVKPGQAGNAAFFGHSSNNIFNPGKYKFAFVLLHKLTNGDTFYLTSEGKTYAYEVISSRIVKPTEVGVLGPVEGQTATATLITCDPPGTSINRLVVVGKQISPDPAGNTAPATTPTPTPAITATDTSLPGNGPTLWGRIWDSIF